MQINVIYPYSTLFAPILRQIAYEKKIDVASAIMPGKFYENGIDASYADEGSDIGIPISNKLDEEISKSTSIIWAAYDYNNTAFFEKVVCKMMFAIETGKNIICQQKLSNDLLHKFNVAAKKHNVLFDYQYDDIKNYKKLSTESVDLRVPIITVIGMGENCSKFETQLAIRRELADSGYKISLIASRQGCRLLGVHDFPEFMFCKEYSEADKINLFRNYVSELEIADNPDAIIIGVPGGIMPLNEKHDMQYGILCYEVFSAIKSDFNIMNLWCQEYNDDFLSELEKIMKYRFNTLLDCVCFSNLSINNDSIDSSELEFDMYDCEMANIQMKKITKIPAYSIFNNNSFLDLKKQILRQLSGS